MEVKHQSLRLSRIANDKPIKNIKISSGRLYNLKVKHVEKTK